MSDLSKIEKLKLEKAFDMSGGYVLDFSNRTFEEFILDSVKIDIYTEKYDYYSGSKANRLRAFWDKESNYIAGKLIKDLVEYTQTLNLINGEEKTSTEKELLTECLRIADRLMSENPIENAESFNTETDDKDFNLLAKSIRESILKNEPEVAIDRLHTFSTKYIRQLCENHGLQVDKSKPLHSLFGEYLKFIRTNNLIEADMTERILKSTISVLDAFNSVRNNQSFAHDNPILNYDESSLIFNHISASIRFIERIEEQINANKQKETEIDTNWDDLPF